MVKSTEKFFEKKKEWSMIKDSVLSCYLKPYFSKIRMTKKPILYIDGFAGTGVFQDGTNGSPLIAYSIAKEVDEYLDIQFVFIEKKYSKELKENTKDCENCIVIDGNYEDNIVDLIQSGVNKNVFVYIDPFGIKNMNFDYFKKMNESELYSVEFLMNLNSFGFFREGCRLLKVDCELKEDDEDMNELSGIEHMNEIAGGDYWQKIISDYKNGIINAYEAEKQFAKQYCERIMSENTFKYVINIPIRHKNGAAPKYRLVFGTNHIEGVILMNDNMSRRAETMSNIHSGGMSSLFAQNSENEIITYEDIEQNIVSLLNDNFIDYNEFLFNYIKQFGVTKTQIINSVLKKMENEKYIEIKRIPEITKTGRKSSFITCTHDKKCYLRKMQYEKD